MKNYLEKLTREYDVFEVVGAVMLIGGILLFFGITGGYEAGNFGFIGYVTGGIVSLGITVLGGHMLQQVGFYENL